MWGTMLRVISLEGSSVADKECLLGRNTASYMALVVREYPLSAGLAMLYRDEVGGR